MILRFYIEDFGTNNGWSLHRSLERYFREIITNDNSMDITNQQYIRNFFKPYYRDCHYSFGKLYSKLHHAKDRKEQINYLICHLEKQTILPNVFSLNIPGTIEIIERYYKSKK
ncbi:hypothetical protein Catovirus_1_255 [Catovirus CTV1]|uniref:Uncharacterized protein n=1 Tax=Catovirus CTV1 TaxID=1977631 RepID=A0A1V0S916_9VIRU|nr:hypothetical protein Catovirus_1_255 [Catovirus CTV1]